MTPQPPIPPGCNITGLPFMQWHVHRFLTSDLVAVCTPVEGWAAVLLWNKAWERTPAGSLPNDDAQLARLAGYPMPLWRKARAVALRNWTLCDDGRLYHPVVAEQVLEAWLARLGARKRSEAGNAAKHDKTFDPAEVDALIADAKWRLAHVRGEDPGPPPFGLPKGEPREAKGAPSRLPSGSQVKVEGKRATQEEDDSQGRDVPGLGAPRVVVPFRRGVQ